MTRVHLQAERAEHEAAKQQTTGADSTVDTRTLKTMKALEVHSPGHDTHVLSEDLKQVAVYLKEADATELVRRWNSHNDLLAALEQLEATATKINNIQHSGRRVPSIEWSALYSDSAFARAAINKAKTL